MTIRLTTRPPYWSVQTPRKDPHQRAGQDRRADQQAELRFGDRGPALIWTPMIEKIVHTAKQAVKAKVLIQSAEGKSNLVVSIDLSIGACLTYICFCRLDFHQADHVRLQIAG
jgi:hypothetical protein